MKLKNLFGLIWPNAKCILRPITKLIRWIRREYVHELVVSRDGQSAFGMIGDRDDRWRLLFARYCFGDNKSFDTKYGVHISSMRYAQVMAARHGLVLFSRKRLPDQVGSEFLRVPTLVAMRVDIHESEEAFRSTLPSSALDDLRKMRIRGFTFEVLLDSDWAEEFYRLYHKPSMDGRHGEEGYIMQAHKMAKMVREQGGEFIVVSQDGQRVGALLNQITENNYYVRRIGWLHGDPVLRKSSLITALYWFSMKRARQLGYRHVQLGGTPSCIEDGLFQYKSKWGAALDRAETISKSNYLLINPGHSGSKRMLEKHSLLVLNSYDEFVVLSAKSLCDVKLSAAMAKSIARWYTLLDKPSVQGEIYNHDLPLNLRPWFRMETTANRTLQ